MSSSVCGPAWAGGLSERVSLHGAYHGDLVAFEGGPERRGAAVVDLLSMVAEADLRAVAPGLLALVHIGNTSGDSPNDMLGTARGFDNSEVARRRLRLYEAWIEQRFGEGGGSVIVGFYDFNSEFNATSASALFLGPGYGVSTEISGAAPGGPSIFPSTGLGVRARFRTGERGYLQAAVINARVGVLGDPGGPQFDFGQGVLLAGEAGVSMQGARLAMDAWRYSRPLSDSRSSSRDDHAQWGYLLIERPLGGEDSDVTGFLRAGISDGRTGDFAGGLQAGVNLALSSTPVVIPPGVSPPWRPCV